MEIVTCRPIALVWLMSTLRKISSEKVMGLCPICLLGVIPGLCYSPDYGQEQSESVQLSQANPWQSVRHLSSIMEGEAENHIGLKFWISLNYLYWSSQNNYLRKQFKVVYPSGIRTYLIHSNINFGSSECYLKYTLPKNACEQSGR